MTLYGVCELLHVIFADMYIARRARVFYTLDIGARVFVYSTDDLASLQCFYPILAPVTPRYMGHMSQSYIFIRAQIYFKTLAHVKSSDDTKKRFFFF